jgi:hypothetical protein
MMSADWSEEDNTLAPLLPSLTLNGWARSPFIVTQRVRRPPGKGGARQPEASLVLIMRASTNAPTVGREAGISADILNGAPIRLRTLLQRRWWRLQAFISTLAGQKRQVARRRSELTTAPGTTADTADTRPHHAGIAADPLWYHVLEIARAIVFEWCGATRAGIVIIPRRATVRG